MARACQVLGDDHRLDRFEKLLSKLYWSDFNASKIAQRATAKVEVEHWAAPDRVAFSHIASLRPSMWKPVLVGDTVIKPSWSTHWFKLTANIPDSWSKVPVLLVWWVQTKCRGACETDLALLAGMPIARDSYSRRVGTHFKVSLAVTGATGVPKCC